MKREQGNAPGQACPMANRPLRAGSFAVVALATALSAGAAELETGTDLKMRWDNTFKYSGAFRLKQPSALLTADPTLDDGDRNFHRGLISNRVDWLSELDLTYNNVGARVSAAAWYDSVYQRRNDNNSPFTANAVSVPYNEFTAATAQLHGRKAELLDAFVFGKFESGDIRSNVTLGKHALLYGESLFFGANGIAAGQLPIDVIKALSVPNSQFKEIARPVNQLSGQVQLNANVSLGAYAQWRWERNRIPAAGSYFSPADLVDAGGERIVAAALPGVGPVAAFYRGNDVQARNSGQGGLQLRYRPEGANADFGFYATRYHAKDFQVYVRPGVGAGMPADRIGSYVLVFPEAIRSFGASFSTNLGETNVAGEVSVRHNAPLVSLTMPDLNGTGDNRANPLYAIGKTAHAQVSAISVLADSSFWNGATVLGEIAWNRTTSIGRNPAALDPNTTRDAFGLRAVFEPSYFQVADGLDLTLPLGIGYTPSGRSSAVGSFGVEKGGDVSIGVKADYLKTWRLSLNLTHFYGAAGPISVAGIQSFKQFSADRDFLAFSVSRTF
ncbi:MAG: DUF1302 domain-containing protein [Pseudomonadota bacterium]